MPGEHILNQRVRLCLWLDESPMPCLLFAQFTLPETERASCSALVVDNTLPNCPVALTAPLFLTRRDAVHDGRITLHALHRSALTLCLTLATLARPRLPRRDEVCVGRCIVGAHRCFVGCDVDVSEELVARHPTVFASVSCTLQM